MVYSYFFAGGTDIISCFAGNNPTIPVYKGEIQCRLLGMAIESWSEEGDLQLSTSRNLLRFIEKV